MRRLATLMFYAVGAVAVAYLALYAYATLRGRALTPGDPIRIFRKPDAPSYSSVTSKKIRREARLAPDRYSRSPI